MATTRKTVNRKAIILDQVGEEGRHAWTLELDPGGCFIRHDYDLVLELDRDGVRRFSEAAVAGKIDIFRWEEASDQEVGDLEYFEDISEALGALGQPTLGEVSGK